MNRMGLTRGWAWIVFLAIAASALGPTVSRGLQAMGGPIVLPHSFCGSAAAPDAVFTIERANENDDALLAACDLCAIAATPVLQASLFSEPLERVPTAAEPRRTTPSTVSSRPLWSSSVPRGPPPIRT